MERLSPKEMNFWMQTVAMPKATASLPLPESADVAVIGAGFTGLSAARVLAKRGAKVVVLEAQSSGWGASSRNGGMVLTGLKLGIDALLKKYGREAARKMYRASVAAIDFVEQIIQEESIECDFVRSGHLELAYKPAHFQQFLLSAEVLARELNHQLRVISRKDLHKEIGSAFYHGGLLDETSAGLNPARYVAGLARAAERAGATLCSQTRVEMIERETGRNGKMFRVNTSRGILRVREVFVATNGYTGDATPSLRKKIVPIGSYIIVTEPLGEDMAREVSPANRMMFDSKNFLYYFRLTPDRRMLFGGRAAFFPETAKTIRKSAEILRQGMIRVFPQLRISRVEYAWGGTLDFAFDLLPHAGQLDGLYFALGYAGHGVAMSTYLGAKMANAICGEREENPFAEMPFPGAPLGIYHRTPWFLPLVGAWYKFLDWIN
jgi:glycine/D-amino acid oxidase-like deaminating enzyme